MYDGRIVETLIPLLKAAGAGDVKPISLETSRLPNDALRACELLFKMKAKEALDADPPGRIRCRIVDEHGQPLAGANVHATLQLTVLTISTPGGYLAASYPQALDRFRATTGPDGQLELQGLCKGVYIVKAEAPGRAWAERKAILNPALDAASVEIVLKPGLTITGVIRDEQGQPIRGATVTTTQWEYQEDGRTTTTTSCDWVTPAAFDSKGRFRFVDLPSGHYTFEIKAPQFQPVQVEKVPAGTRDVTVTLKRSKPR